jgi:hypothetical protein
MPVVTTAHAELDYEEPSDYGVDSTSPLPRHGEKVRDAERLAAQLLRVLEQITDPASEPDVLAWPAMTPNVHVHDLLFAQAAINVKYVLRSLEKIASLPAPPAGSAVKLPVAAGKEPTPGSAVVLRGATSESQGPVVGAEAGKAPDSSPGSGPPVSPPARGVGPDVLGPLP